MILLALGEEHGSPIWRMFDDDELRIVSVAMSQLGSIEASAVESDDRRLRLADVGDRRDHRSYDHTEMLLQKMLPPDQASAIMEEIRGPAGRNMWQKLSNVERACSPAISRTNIPQTIAVILSKISRTTPPACSRAAEESPIESSSGC